MTPIRTSQKISNDLNDDSMLDFQVVGIGASAGGLEALQDFFAHIPLEPDAAFVVIQHLSPDYKSFMDELLARHTKIPIQVVSDGTVIKRNHIYLIPPKMNMTIFKGKLFLNQNLNTRSLNLPIDIFFRSLALDQKKNAVGIILSGTGSDGTLGTRAIKEYGGMTMVQDDKTAKFDGMPRSSIATGMVDFILPTNQLAEELINYIKHPLISQTQRIESILSQSKSELEKIIAIIREQKGVDFSLYKENTIVRRLEKRISINRLISINEYVNFLMQNNSEVNILFDELLIGVTRFFRDESSFQTLNSEVISKLSLKHLESSKEIRIWVPACSTGEEVYSLAILLKECNWLESSGREIKIFATDIDTDSLEIASIGQYPSNIVSDISPVLLKKYFKSNESGYQISDTIRSLVIFAKHNILNDPPFSKVDLISCRNLLIYFNPEAQTKVLSTFHNALNINGYLFLGSSESLGGLSDGFKVVSSKAKIFEKDSNYKPDLVYYGNVRGNQNSLTQLKNSSNYRLAQDHWLNGVFEEIIGDFVPPSVIVDEKYEIIHTVHNVGDYISFPVGRMNLNLLKLLDKNMAILVNSMIRKSLKTTKPIVAENIHINSSKKTLKISCRKIQGHIDSGRQYFIISFLEVSSIDKKILKLDSSETYNIEKQYQERIEELEKDLQFKSENLQATVEELETSNEELQSSNEELIASNEELQSTNEELQSVNEELYTVNNEHIRKIEELSLLTSDFENLLRNTMVGHLYLDMHLNIRKVNSVATEITDIMPSDVGRSIYHLSLRKLYSKFIDDLQSVLSRLEKREVEIESQNGHWFLMRIIPYRTIENAVDGVIITFVDISNFKNQEKESRVIDNRLSAAMDMGKMSWWEWDYELNLVVTGEGKHKMLGYEQSEVGKGFEWWTKQVHPDDYHLCMEAMAKHLKGEAEFYSVEYRIKHKEGYYIWYRDKGGIATRNPKGGIKKIVGIVADITQEKINEQKVFEVQNNISNRSTEHILGKLLLTNCDSGIIQVDSNREIIKMNQFANELFLNLPKHQIIDSIYNKVYHLNGLAMDVKESPAYRAEKELILIESTPIGLMLEPNIITWFNWTCIPIVNAHKYNEQSILHFFFKI